MEKLDIRILRTIRSDGNVDSLHNSSESYRKVLNSLQHLFIEGYFDKKNNRLVLTRKGIDVIEEPKKRNLEEKNRWLSWRMQEKYKNPRDEISIDLPNDINKIKREV